MTTCPQCGSANLDANTWEVWCFACDWQSDTDEDLRETVYQEGKARRSSLKKVFEAAQAQGRWTPIELKAAREALGLTLNSLAGALISPETGNPWRVSRVSDCERGVRAIPSWVAEQIEALEEVRDELADKMVTAMEADPEGVLVVHDSDASLWEAHPEMKESRIPAAVHRVAAALAAAEIQAETGVRPRLLVQERE